MAGTGGTPSIGYTITAPASGLGVFPDTGFKAIGNWNASNAIVITFDTTNVFSAGGSIWLSDINGGRVTGSTTVSFSDGSSILVPSSTTGAFGFAGITTNGSPLTTMTIASAAPSYVNLTNFSVAVPEPSSIGLVLVASAASGLGYLVVRIRRRRLSESAVR